MSLKKSKKKLFSRKALGKEFFMQPTLKVAKTIIGKRLHYKGLEGKIVEAEAYLRDDPACHASRGMTPRNKTMFGPAGRAYVYFTYGMYHCFNVVTQREGVPEAVLIRAVEPTKGIDEMKRNRNGSEDLTNGPGRLCQAFGITKKLDGVDMTKGDFVILDSGERPKVIKAKRIGITQNADKPWRFYDRDSRWVSKI